MPLGGEIEGKEIVCLSGVEGHLLAVSKEGKVFAFGNNNRGALSLGNAVNIITEFKEITSLRGYNIKAAYAGREHSLFQTSEGKILSCGHDRYGELLIGNCQREYIYLPEETTITGGATFCIVGDGISVVFIGSNPPPNSPNIRIMQFK